ncbi:unnamed protein product, partial [Brassica rapa subsp. narinosa]
PCEDCLSFLKQTWCFLLQRRSSSKVCLSHIFFRLYNKDR